MRQGFAGVMSSFETFCIYMLTDRVNVSENSQ